MEEKKIQKIKKIQKTRTKKQESKSKNCVEYCSRVIK